MSRTPAPALPNGVTIRAAWGASSAYRVLLWDDPLGVVRRDYDTGLWRARLATEVPTSHPSTRSWTYEALEGSYSTRAAAVVALAIAARKVTR